ncbi:MAG: hypothetical protein LBR70_04970 [Lactobacillaceae bacterium]|jgi:NifU-like protein involved in Fe-S cluster formation|nr:hypothetical protein [Lactobacillaceae bacterium]
MKKYIFLAFLVIIGAGGYYLFNNLEIIVRKLVNKYGSEITGTKVDLQGFKLNLANGEGKIEKFTVANPKGYETPYLFSTDEIYVRVNMKSLTSNAIVIEEIRVDKPAMTYEMLSVMQNNVGDILKNVKNNTQSAEEKVKEDAKKEPAGNAKAGKKVIINKISINATNLAAVIPSQGIEGVIETKAVDKTIVLPDIVIKDIGKGKDGDSIVTAISKVMTRILDEATSAVAKNKLDDVKAVAKENLDKAIDSVKEKIDAKGIFDKLKK